MKEHIYTSIINWTGNNGTGTSAYQDYGRSYSIEIPGKEQIIQGSADPNFLGDPSKINPEELLLQSISSCHMLSYLHLCAIKGITVITYKDEAKGTMITEQHGGGRFSEVTLYPVIQILEADKIELAQSLHSKANKYCFIANSCNFPIHHSAQILAH